MADSITIFDYPEKLLRIFKLTLTRDSAFLIFIFSMFFKQEFPPLLPLGFHPMTLPEMRESFVDKISGTKRRGAVMDGLEKVIGQIVADKLECEIWIDGSFLTAKIDPDDSDILVIMQDEFYGRVSVDQKHLINRLFQDAFHARELCHTHVLWIYPKGHVNYEQAEWWRAYWHRQFGFSRKDKPKGIATMKLS